MITRNVLFPALLLVLVFPARAYEVGQYYDTQVARLQTLSGSWSFYCEEQPVASPELKPTVYDIPVPGSWRGYQCPQGKLPATGRHRFHLVIRGQMRLYGLGLYLPPAGTSMVVYWNGYKIHESGDFAAGKPGFRAATVPIAFSEHNDLVVDVGNFDNRYGGMWQAPQIGTLDELRNVRKYRFTFDGMVSGVLFFLALYSIAVYAGIRSKPYLYLGIFTLAMSLRTLIEGERIAHALLGRDWWYFLTRLAHLAVYAGVLSFFAYIKTLFRDQRWRWWELVPVSLLLVYDVLAIFTPPVFFTEFLNAALLALVVLFAEILFYVIAAVRKGQKGIYPLFLGICILFLAAVNDILRILFFLPTIEFVPVALLLFMLINAAGLELMEYRLRILSRRLDANIRDRLAGIERLAPGLAQKFSTVTTAGIAHNAKREQIPVRFSVMFADLRRFTELSESRTPEEVLALINKYLETVVPEILRAGGQVLEYQGDGVLAYFTAGADTCLRAAKAMQAALHAAMDRGELPELQMGIAMHVGAGVLTLLGNRRRLEPAIISAAMPEVQDLETLCAHFSVPYVYSEAFFRELSRDLQRQTVILTNFSGAPVFTLNGDFVTSATSGLSSSTNRNPT